MNGNRYLLDTNTIIELLKGYKPLETLLTNADWIGVSVISVFEFLAYPKIMAQDRNLLLAFLAKVEVINIIYPPTWVY